MKPLFVLIAVLCATAAATAADQNPPLEAYRNIPLWDPGQVPGAQGDGPLDAPFLTVFTPRAGTANGSAVVAASDAGDAGADDAIERASSRPDWAGLVYGAGRASPEESLAAYPPTFLLSAAGDQGPSLANAQLFVDLTKAGADAELHVYQRGRHGFGSGVGSAHPHRERRLRRLRPRSRRNVPHG